MVEMRAKLQSRNVISHAFIGHELESRKISLHSFSEKYGN